MDDPGYSPLFYVMLIIGIIGVVFFCTGSALVGGM